MMKVERRRSLRKSLRPLAFSAWFASAESKIVNVPEGSQKRLVILWFGWSRAVVEKKIVGLPVQDGALFGKQHVSGLDNSFFGLGRWP